MLFTPKISDERMQELILQAARNSNYYISEVGAPVSGWTNQKRKEPVIRIGMEYYKPEELVPLFEEFLSLAGTELNV